MTSKNIFSPKNYLDSFERILTSIGLIILAVIIGIVGYLFIEKMSLLDAIYMTIITVTGSHRELYPLSTAGKIFTIFFIIFGVTAVIYTAGTVIEFIIEGNIGGIRRRRKMDKILGQMKDHYMICGFGRVGHQIAAQFDIEKVKYVIIDSKPETYEELESKGVPFVIGNVSSDEVLQKAGIEYAKGLIAAADSDTENVYVTLTAKVMNPKIHIIARSAHKETESKLKKAGADSVISPYFIAGNQMACMMLEKTA